MEILLSFFIGIGLSAASGFRIFIPFIILGIAVPLGYVELNDNFSWISSLPAIIIFSVVSLTEVFGYFNPWIDNMLDTIATPMSLIAGIILSLSVMTGLDSIWEWVLVIILGGGIAANFQFLTVKARSVSSIFNSGYGNPIISCSELFFSILLSILSVLMPVIAFITVILLLVFLFILLKKAKAKLNESFS